MEIVCQHTTVSCSCLRNMKVSCSFFQCVFGRDCVQCLKSAGHGSQAIKFSASKKQVVSFQTDHCLLIKVILTWPEVVTNSVWENVYIDASNMCCAANNPTTRVLKPKVKGKFLPLLWTYEVLQWNHKASECDQFLINITKNDLHQHQGIFLFSVIFFRGKSFKFVFVVSFNTAL